MIISHEHKYLFVEIPLTASWAIRHELCEHYGGTPILHKHASYPEFLRVATPEEKQYFAFATVRNPLDVAVSIYCKYKVNYKGAFTDPSSLMHGTIDYSDLAKYRFVQQDGVGFADYFLRFHKRPFSNVLLDTAREGLGFVMRFEHLQDDFRQVLHLLELAPVRPLPVVNKTPGKNREWQQYYAPSIRPRAKRVFGPFMCRWDYAFPSDWDAYVPGWRHEVEFRLWSRLQRLYWLRFRYNDSLMGKLVRRLRRVF